MPEQIIGIFIGLLFVFILLLIAAANIKIVPQATVFVIERLGTYYAPTVWSARFPLSKT